MNSGFSFHSIELTSAKRSLVHVAPVKLVLLALIAPVVFGIALFSHPSDAHAGPATVARQHLKKIKRFENKLARLLAQGKVNAIQLSNLAVASSLADSDGDGIPDIVESAKGTLDACNPDSDGDGDDDGDDDDNGGSSSSSSGSSSSSSSGSSSSSTSSSSSGGGSSSSTSSN